MRFSRVAPLLPLASAFVLPEPEIFSKIEKSGKQLADNAQNVLGDTFRNLKDGAKDAYSKVEQAGFDVTAWLESAEFDGPHHGKPHHGKPHHGEPHHDEPPCPPNRTVYELINESKYTTKLAELINEYDDLVELLNGTSANYTVFAPTDKAFEKLPEHAPKPPKDFLKNLLLYHVTDDLYPAGRVLKSYTIPTLYKASKNLGHAQRLAPKVTLKGPTLNYYSRIVSVNHLGTNGIVHGVDTILAPPPNVARIITMFPGEFSTLELALIQTGIFEKMNNTDYEHNGGTFFAPSNYAFKKLGPRANAFLFSKYGGKYLKALLEYHIVVDQTLYSDAFIDGTKDGDDKATDIHSSQFHYDLPTLLSDKYLSVDVGRWGPFVEIRINGFSRVTASDGVASDGVIHVVSNVLIPPRNPGGDQVFWNGEELEVEDLKERLQPFVDNMEL